jgi:hypothetical protein
MGPGNGPEGSGTVRAAFPYQQNSYYKLMLFVAGWADLVAFALEARETSKVPMNQCAIVANPPKPGKSFSEFLLLSLQEKTGFITKPRLRSQSRSEIRFRIRS